MNSDVALLLVDAARLTTDPHTQAVYLKQLLGNVRSSIRRMRNELLDDGKRLIQFPRIWVLTLSKADLLPEMTATEFADVLTLHAGEDINQLRKAIADLVEEGAVSLGEDFLRLSSAQFTPAEIDTQTTIGLDMIVPLTMLLPVDHFARWQERKLLPAQKTRQVLQQFNHMSETLNLDLRAMAGVSLMSRFANKVPRLGGVGSLTQFATALSFAAQLGAQQLERLEADARANQDYLRAAYYSLEGTLAKAEEDGVLVRRNRR